MSRGSEGPRWHYEEVGGVQDVVDKVAAGQVPCDASFSVEGEGELAEVRATWYGYAGTALHNARWHTTEQVRQEGREQR